MSYWIVTVDGNERGTVMAMNASDALSTAKVRFDNGTVKDISVQESGDNVTRWARWHWYPIDENGVQRTIRDVKEG